MSENQAQNDQDPSKGNLPGKLVLRELVRKLSQDGKPRMAEKHTVKRNGLTYVTYRRPDQIAEGKFIRTSTGGDFHVRDFRGGPANLTADFNDEAGAKIAGELGQIRLTSSRGIHFVINQAGALEEVNSDNFGNEVSRREVAIEGTDEIVNLIQDMKPGMMWWEKGIPHYPDEQPK